MAEEEGVRDGRVEGENTEEDSALAASPRAQEGSMVHISYSYNNYTNLEILAIDHSMHNFNTIYYIEHKEAINMVHTIIIQY